ncbi:MAG: hypothetical protein Q8L11_01375 [Candidatus Moranbacteria bacterium]|nr:hypothetical protein [Candidatus Moranbacteria bacterium]
MRINRSKKAEVIYREVFRIVDAMEAEMVRKENEKIFLRLWKIFHKKPEAFARKIIDFLEVAAGDSEETLAESKDFIQEFYEWMMEMLGDDYGTSVEMIRRFRLFSEVECLWQIICCNRRLISEKQFTKLLARRKSILLFSEVRPNKALAEKIKSLQEEWRQARIAYVEEKRSTAEIKKSSMEIVSVPIETGRRKVFKEKEPHHSGKERLRSGINELLGGKFVSGVWMLSKTELSNLKKTISLLGVGVAERLLMTKKHLANNSPFMDAINSDDDGLGRLILDRNGGSAKIKPVSQFDPGEADIFSFPSDTSVVIVGGCRIKKWQLLSQIIMRMGARDCQFVFSENLEKIGRITEDKLIIFLANINSHKAGNRLCGRKKNLLRIYSSNASTFGEVVAREYLAAKISGRIT